MGVGVGFDMTRSNIPFGSLDVCVLIRSLTEQRQKPHICLGVKTYYSNVGATTMFSKKTCRLAMWSSEVVSDTAAPYLNVSS